MTLIKKLLMVTMMIMALVTFACAEDAAAPTFEWERDGVNHWQLDASGAVINQGAHDSSDEAWTCTVCGSEVIDWGEGSYSVSNYDAYGNTLRYSSYEGGELTYDSTHALTYNEDGVVLEDKEYIGGVLYSQTLYVVDAEGTQLPAGSTAWNEDGTTTISEYDEFGNNIRSAVYEADGSVVVEIFSEYAKGDDGWFYESSNTTVYPSGERFHTERNQYGDPVRTLNTEADGTPWSDTVYEYEYRDYSKVWCKQYEFGRLTWEYFYNEEGLTMKEVEYLEEGGTVICLYNEQTDMISATTYAADGTMVTETTYECIYDEDMNLEAVRTYVDGVLQVEE